MKRADRRVLENQSHQLRCCAALSHIYSLVTDCASAGALCKMIAYIHRHSPRRVEAYICHFSRSRLPIHQSRRGRRTAQCFSALLHLHISSRGAVHCMQASRRQASPHEWRPSPFAPRLLEGSGFRWQVSPPRSIKMHNIPSTRHKV